VSNHLLKFNTHRSLLGLPAFVHTANRRSLALSAITLPDLEFEPWLGS